MVMLRVIAVLISLHVLAFPAIAFTYTPTPLQKSIQDHDLIVVATVVKSEQGRCEIEASTVIKGNRPKKNIVLPAMWRPNEKLTFGSIELTKGSKYLLLLKSKNGKHYLSSDYASYSVNKIDSDEAVIVGVVAILYKVLEAKDAKE